MKTIFLQIASYRDTELPFTIESALSKARDPDRLRFGICWQYDDETATDLEQYQDDDRFRIDRIHYSESKGCCWARNRTNLLYRDEYYTLQIDAHMRFLDGWDRKLIAMLESIEHDKPLLTTYPPHYSLVDGEAKLVTDAGIQKLKLKYLHPDLTTTQECELVEQTDEPGKSEFLAAGFLFTLGQFCREVEYDPEIYFSGEEVGLAARAYTHGYNFFYPNENLIWHRYNHGSPLHWSDNPDTQQDKHKFAVERMEMLLLGDHTGLGKYGLGTARTLKQFENYANIRFADVIVARDSVEKDFFLRQVIKLNTYAIERRTDYECWMFCLLNDDDKELHREEIRDPDILTHRLDSIKINQLFEGVPTKYKLRPKTAEGWGEEYIYPVEISEPKSKTAQAGVHTGNIFIALAAYCEPELKLTIKNCIEKAARPDRLHFGVCLQYDNDGVEAIHSDCIDDMLTGHTIRIVKYPHASSKGGCWARNIVQSLYRAEEYTLQVDAHSRFVDGWDDILINMMRELPSEKPLITGFPPLYYINEGVEEFTSADDLSCVPTTTVVSWSEGGWIDHPTEYIAQNTSVPRRTRVLSGAFVFTLGRWNVDVNQDPDHLYTGEEFALTLRSYTSGYDLFNPTQIVVWHRCHPKPNRKYITDFDQGSVDKRHVTACRRLRLLLDGDPGQQLAPFSLGLERTLDDYRIFSGLDCKNHLIHDDTRKGVPPDPVTLVDEYIESVQQSENASAQMMNVSIQLVGMETLELQCESLSPVIDVLVAGLEANAARRKGDADPMMFLQYGDDEDHEVYFLQSTLVSLQIRAENLVPG